MNITTTNKCLEYHDIKDIYLNGCKKSESDLEVGLEYERLPIFTKSFEAADYDGENGIYAFLRNFSREDNWDYITDDFNIIGLKQGHDTITLEPGCQIEFSIKPQKTIAELKKSVEKLDAKISPVLKQLGITLLNYGVSPLSTNKHISLIPKQRYAVMAKYLWGILSDVMMRETAGIQGTFDFVDEEDAMRKFKIANMLAPFMTAMFANSPIRGGVDTGYKSFRALSWLNTDNDRCGFYTKFISDETFDDYINRVMETPMIFINRHGSPVKLNGTLDFKEFMVGGKDGFEPELDDYLLQANLCFPEVRLRNFVEIRNHDCGNKNAPYSMLAIYKGILYNETAMDEIEELFKKFTPNDFNELRYNVPKNAMNTSFNKNFVKDFAKEILYIAEKSLISQGLGEEIFLDYIKTYATEGISPADVILKNWYGRWNKDLNKLIEFIS